MSMDRLRRQAQTRSQNHQSPNQRQIAPGKVTRTGALSMGAGSLQRKASAAGGGALTGRMPAAPVQRKPAAPDRRADGALVDDWMLVALRPDLHQEPIQRKSNEIGYAHAEPPAPQSGGGRAMPAAVQAKMEHAFGADFSAVSIHEGPEAAAIGALAYTRGTDIHVAPGQYQPDTQRGQELLGHELAHVVQQSQGRVRATTQARGVDINDDAALEREADEMGARAARGREASMGAAGPLSSSSGAGGPAVQRWLAVTDPDGNTYTDMEDPEFAEEAHIALRAHSDWLDQSDPMDFPGVFGNYLENFGVFRHYLTRAHNSRVNHGVFDLRDQGDVLRLYYLLKDAVLGDVGALHNSQDFPGEPSGFVTLSGDERLHLWGIIDRIDGDIHDRYGRLAQDRRDLFEELYEISFHLGECLGQGVRPRAMALDELTETVDSLIARIEGLVKSKDEVIEAIIEQARLASNRWTDPTPAQKPPRYDTGFHGAGRPNAIVTQATLAQVTSEWKDRIHGALGIEKYRLDSSWSLSGPQTYKDSASRAQDFLIQVYFGGKWVPAFNFHIEVMKQ
jgi:hypothetical protein